MHLIIFLNIITYTVRYTVRYTLSSGLAQISNRVRLKFAAMNLKKPARRKAARQPKFLPPYVSPAFTSLCFAARPDHNQTGRFLTG